MKAEAIVDLQIASKTSVDSLPSNDQLHHWVAKALVKQAVAEVTIRIVDEEESQQLNFNYRQQNKATNVLSFPFEVPMEIDLPLLGDLVICAPVVIREASEQTKVLESHWAHLVIHGVLHLQGFDHIHAEEAKEMESLESCLMAELGYHDPYYYQNPTQPMGTGQIENNE